MLKNYRFWFRLFQLGLVASIFISLMFPVALPHTFASGSVTIPTTGTVTQLFLGTFSKDFKGKYYDQNDQLASIATKAHEGVDIAGGTSSDCINNHLSPVYAAGAGMVTSTKYDTSGYGWSVVIQHGLSVSGNSKYIFTHYAHMGTPDTKNTRGTSCVAVSPGQNVSAGQLIGYQGSSGNSTGTHLHWGIKANPTKDSWNGSYWASPDFYTCMALTVGDGSPLGSVTSGQNLCSSSHTYFDDFSTYALGSIPSGWTQYGTTNITPRVIEYGGSGTNYQRLEFPAYTAESTSKSLIRDNLSATMVTATIKLNFQTSNDGGGLIVAWQDPGNYIAILPNPFWDEIVVWEFANGQLRSATNPGGRFSVPINTNQDYWLRVVTSQDQSGINQLDVYWSTDGQNFTKQSTATNLANLTGRFGVGTYQFLTDTLFDDFSVDY